MATINPETVVIKATLIPPANSSGFASPLS